MNRSTWIVALAGIGLFLIIAAALGLLSWQNASFEQSTSQ